jgi:hypothetical protein
MIELDRLRKEIMITAEQYEAAVGHPPEQDDLERSNCDKAGQIGHECCGWDHERNLPEFIAVAHRLKEGPMKFTPHPTQTFRDENGVILWQELRTDVKFVIARGPWRWFLNRLGCMGITMPWKRIYILSEHQFNESLRRHELVHIDQIDREGAVRFSVKYLWWLLVLGYWENPFEIEAYQKAPIHPTET